MPSPSLGIAGEGRGRLRVGACLSLTGQYGRFGRQAAHALKVWRDLDRDAELVLEDDRSDRVRLTDRLAWIADRCDLLLGPYSSQLTRAAARMAPGLDRLLWNHGGSADDVQGAGSHLMVSVPAPTSRYALPFVRLAAQTPARAPLWIVHGEESFGRQVAAGAERAGRKLGLDTVRVSLETPGWEDDRPAVWDLFSVGAFEDDVAVVTRALNSRRPPRALCSVASGVRAFAATVAEREGIYGVAQWFPGRGGVAELGPAEDAFVERYAGRTGAMPDYPAAQAFAAAVIAAHCARATGDLSVETLWQAAVGLDTTTLFGAFRIDPQTGAQVGHDAILVRWTAEGLTAVA